MVYKNFIVIKKMTGIWTQDYWTAYSSFYYRIIGLYSVVVLAIGRALRSYIAALPSKIAFNEIPNPDSLLELCDDIFYVREDGNLRQEEILVGRLFFIFRSPARLIQQTKWKRD